MSRVGTRVAAAKLWPPPSGLARFTHMLDDRIVAVGLLTQSNLDTLGPAFRRAWPVDETPCFSQLLREIDEAGRRIGHADADTSLRVI